MAGKPIDLTGQKFGRLTAIEMTDKRQNKSVVWKCLCQCGNTCEVVAASLRAGRTKSCGCLKQEKDKQPKGNVINLIGKKFGHLTVISRQGSDKRGEALWECECDCDAHTHLIVLGSNLRTGHTTSCGCERRSKGELAVAKLFNDNNISFKQEYKAFKFANGKWASYDFYVNNQYLIEYDGETHYNYNLHGWHNKQQLLAQQERDVIKTQWCKDNNIPLIRDLKLETSEFIV